MGIARRKAGTVVRCPKCAGEIIVPVPDGPAGPEDAAEPAGGNPFDVERLDPAAFPDPAPVSAGPTAATPKEPLPVPTETAPAPAPAPATAPPQRLGVFVPLGMLIISIGVIALLLILLFVIGLIIGRATMIPVEVKSAAVTRELTAGPPVSEPPEAGRARLLPSRSPA